MLIHAHACTCVAVALFFVQMVTDGKKEVKKDYKPTVYPVVNKKH